MTGRDDTLPRLVSGMAGAALAGGLYAQARRRRRVAAGTGSESFVEARSGNLLAYDLRRAPEPVDPADPVVLLLPDIGGTAHHWTVVRRMLARHHSVLSFDRAGYGRSRFRTTAPFSLDAAVADLVDLLEQVCPGRPVVSLGHRLGGTLALRLLDRPAVRTAGLVLLDPRYPGELASSRLLASLASQHGFSLAYMAPSARFGFSSLLLDPEWSTELPADVRRLCLDQFRDVSTWQASRREWQAAHTELSRPDALPTTDVPLCLITSYSGSAEGIGYAALHDDLLKRAGRGVRVAMEDLSNAAMPHARDAAERVCGTVTRFVASARKGDVPS
ncbi:alpha/beta hydrolase [Streptomyces bacillaris]|uniref:alpha/beta hydrolase n=1 Tax=Streptomyces bacillaris TaxID=68179 RepID=UPI0036885E70